jgi:branched-chain amino acid transport system substrate-binding protein
MRELDYKVPQFQSHGSATLDFIKIAGPAAEGTMIAAQKIFIGDELPDADSQKSIITKFVREYTKKYTIPGAMEACGADASNIVVEALKRQGIILQLLEMH